MRLFVEVRQSKVQELQITKIDIAQLFLKLTNWDFVFKKLGPNADVKNTKIVIAESYSSFSTLTRHRSMSLSITWFCTNFPCLFPSWSVFPLCPAQLVVVETFLMILTVINEAVISATCPGTPMDPRPRTLPGGGKGGGRALGYLIVLNSWGVDLILRLIF